MKLKEYLYKKPCKFSSLSPSSAERYDLLHIYSRASDLWVYVVLWKPRLSFIWWILNTV